MKFSSVLPMPVVAISAIIFTASCLLMTAAIDPQEKAENEALREEIPLGGEALQPQPEKGVFLAAGHSGNIVVSRDDGRTWEQSFYGKPCGDHGYWTVWNTLAYTDGVFAIAMGWGRPGTWLATDDGKTWRHLTGPDREAARKDWKLYDMKNTMHLIGVNGAFIAPLLATPDFGKTWSEGSAYGFRDENDERIKVDLSHPSLAYSPANGGRVIVVGGSGPSLYSDDLGKTWSPLQTEIEGWEGRGAQGIVAKGEVFLAFKGEGDKAWRSVDGGQTWEVVEVGVEGIAGRSFSLNVIGDEFWITGEKRSRASRDGVEWRDLPAAMPTGQLAQSDKGTLISVDRKRYNILRSEDGGETWTEVYSFEPHPDASGGAQGFGDVEFGRVKSL